MEGSLIYVPSTQLGSPFFGFYSFYQQWHTLRAILKMHILRIYDNYCAPYSFPPVTDDNTSTSRDKSCTIALSCQTFPRKRRVILTFEPTNHVEHPTVWFWVWSTRISGKAQQVRFPEIIKSTVVHICSSNVAHNLLIGNLKKKKIKSSTA